MFDSGLPPSMWDLAVRAATYVYNRTPHKSIDTEISIVRLNPKYEVDMNQLKRFGCLAYAKIPR